MNAVDIEMDRELLMVHKTQIWKTFRVSFSSLVFFFVFFKTDCLPVLFEMIQLMLRNFPGESQKLLGDYKFKLQKAEQDVSTLQANVS